MEVSLNLLWLLLAVASFALVWRGRGNRALAAWQSLRRILSLACALVIFFPVISLTDDLHAAPVVMEDSNPAMRLSKSSGAPGAASNFDRSSPPFTAVATGQLPGQALRPVGLAAILETHLLFTAPGVRSNPRAPPSPV
ncbi:MAG: hypothetical protein ABSG32_02285 [Terriglobia bacterium]|jgi:hypothetical protein